MSSPLSPENTGHVFQEADPEAAARQAALRNQRLRAEQQQEEEARKSAIAHARMQAIQNAIVAKGRTRATIYTAICGTLMAFGLFQGGMRILTTLVWVALALALWTGVNGARIALFVWACISAALVVVAVAVLANAPGVGGIAGILVLFAVGEIALATLLLGENVKEWQADRRAASR